MRSFAFGQVTGIGITVNSVFSKQKQTVTLVRKRTVVQKFIILNKSSLVSEECVVMKFDQYIVFILT